jgi:hypothetical protein
MRGPYDATSLIEGAPTLGGIQRVSILFQEGWP